MDLNSKQSKKYFVNELVVQKEHSRLQSISFKLKDSFKKNTIFQYLILNDFIKENTNAIL